MTEDKPKKYYSVKEIFSKAMRFCVYQERSYNQVREKLSELGLYGNEVDEMLLRLSKENFLNEERYAKAYVSGKFRQNKWGKIKIKQGLKFENISEYCTKKGFLEINDDEYGALIQKLISQKWNLLTEKNILLKKKKVYNYLLSKGFESDLILDILKQII